MKHLSAKLPAYQAEWSHGVLGPFREGNYIISRSEKILKTERCADDSGRLTWQLKNICVAVIGYLAVAENSGWQGALHLVHRSTPSAPQQVRTKSRFPAALVFHSVRCAQVHLI